MLRCYLLALASGSSVDQASNNFTLFNLVEQLSFAEGALGQELAIEAHIYWLVDAEARGKEFEVRVIRRAADGVEDAGAPLPFSPPMVDRVRFRTGAFRMPRAYGRYLLAVDWRLKGSEAWTRDPAIWPLVVVTADQRVSQQPSAPEAPVSGSGG